MRSRLRSVPACFARTSLGGVVMKRPPFVVGLVLVLSFLFAPGAPWFQPDLYAGQKTVKVREYKRKDGTVVKAHERRAPRARAAEPERAQTPPPSQASSSVKRDENGRIERSEAARRAFMRETGYPNGRPGYIVDHVKPLACGGMDAPSNMQWQTIAEAKAKDRVERVGC